MLFAFQAQAQYTGVAYQGNIPQIGETIGVPVKIEMEYFDALDGDPNGDGANYGAAASPLTAGATYWDKSPGSENPNGNPIRVNSDVDIEAAATGAVVAFGQGQEFTVYTVNVVTAGTYHMGVNYLHGGTSKDIRLESFNPDGTNRIDLYNTLSTDGLPASGGEYITTDDLGSFDLPAGPLLLKFVHLDAGPRYDFFTLTLDEPTVIMNPGYSGVAYQDNIPQLGETLGVPVQIESENYDALIADPNGDGANYNDPTDDIPIGELGTYYDDSAGGTTGGNTARTTSDVDIKAGGTGNVVTDVKPNEYTVYTVNVVTAGTYHMGVNYKHGGTSKDIKVYTHNTDGTSKTLIYDSNSDGGLPQSDYVTTDSLGSFDLPAGPLLIRFRTLDTGPSYDFFTFTLVSVPNPSYSGVAYQGNIPQLGETPGVPVQIEMENYDALIADPNGDGANYNDPTDDIPGGELGTYYDDSPGGTTGGNTARMTSDVDIKAGGTGNVVTDVKPNEYTIYTVNVVTAGTYHFGLNYKHGGTSKDIKLYTHNTDGSGKTLIYDSNPDDGLPQSDYVTVDSLGSFDLPAGPLLIRFRTLDTGPSYDFMTFTLDDVVNTEDLRLETNAIKAFPNPANNGIFNVNIEDEWDVFSWAGAKVLEGTGNVVDLSHLPKGVYILKTPYASAKLISF